MVITTDRRVYHLELESRTTGAMAALSWHYPQDELIALRRRQDAAAAARPIASGLAVEKLNFHYRISGDEPAWRPLRAFDDGRQTFIEFPPSIAVGEAPPMVVIGDDGKAQLVNYPMAADQTSGVSGKRVTVRLDPGGRRILKNKQNTPTT